MNANQVKWASQHDWFRSSRAHPVSPKFGYIVVVWDSVTNRELEFLHYSILKAWAGY